MVVVDVNSQVGKDYLMDLNACLEYALLNRCLMAKAILDVLDYVVSSNKPLDTNPINLSVANYIKTGKIPKNVKDIMSTPEPYFVNRNHNHAVFEHGLWIVRKGATHAAKGMYGVLPMNMSHGTYIILGKGNSNALYSAPHGAGRRLSRRAAKETVEVELHALDMEGIVCDPVENTLDESSFAYKDATGVLSNVHDLMDIIFHIKPILNKKGAKMSKNENACE